MGKIRNTRRRINILSPLMELISKRTLCKSGCGLTSTILSGAKKLISKIPVGAVVNTAIDALPLEIHIPGGYQYCGPGTKLNKRLSRGDPGINILDQACKEHDISYSKYSDSFNRDIADRLLAQKAWARVKSGDASISERAAALAVTAAMKGKTAFGGGCRKPRKKKSKSKRRHGGSLKKRRRTLKKRGKKSGSVWTMIKSGRGLYLKPYRNV